jgi:Ca-activated chloride channel family protein
MPFDSNDPRLTAYALGELDDTELGAIEAIVADSQDARRFVEEVRETARLLREELHAEPHPGLSEEQKHLIEGCLTAPASSPTARNGRARWFGYAVAASVLVGSGVLAVQMIRPAQKEGVQVALNTTERTATHDFDVPASDSTSAVAANPSAVTGWNAPTDGLSTLPPVPAPVATEPTIVASSAESLGMPSFHRFGESSPPAGPVAATPAPAQAKGMMGMMGGEPGLSGGRMGRLGGMAGGAEGIAPKPTETKPATTEFYAYTPDRRSGASRTPGLLAPTDEAARPLALRLESEAPAAPQPPGSEKLAQATRSRGFDAMKRKLSEGANRPAALAAQPGMVNTNGGQKPGQSLTSLGVDAKNQAGKAPVTGPEPVNDPTPLFALSGEQKSEALAKSRLDDLSENVGKPVTREQELVEQKATVALAPKDAEGRGAKESLLDSNAIAPPPPPAENLANEDFAPIDENGFERVTDLPQPTLSIDVDTASYANVRRFLNQNQMPPRDAVRIEEMINYFRYDDPEPKGDDPFSVNVEIARCPWNVNHRIARIGLKGKSIDTANRPMSNLVFLVDVSGSMIDANKLPLLKQSMKMLVETLGENDRVAIVVYAGSEGLALPSTSGERKEVILSSLEQLQAGGSTNGGAGISLAYQIATQNFIKGGVNRVILCTDGDFNVGITDRGQLDKLIEEKAKSKVFLSVLGFGQGNLKDATMESLADKGNGNYSYIDSPKEGQKVLVDEAGATLVTIAKDVKVQVEFNPSHVAAYRLIGYENRVMAAQDFNNDQKDAGEIGAGHNVTVLFELVPPGKELAAAGPPADDLVFQKREPIAADVSKLAMMVKLRYKQPEGDVSKLIQQGVEDTGKDYAAASNDLKFSSAVASFGMLLRGSVFKGSANYDSVLELATASKGEDKSGYRTEFLELVRKAKALTTPQH